MSFKYSCPGVAVCALVAAALVLPRIVLADTAVAGAQPMADGASPDGPGLRLNGFGTLGAMHSWSSDDRVFHRDIAQPSNGGGTRLDVDSRLGLQLNYRLGNQLEAVAQLLLKRRVAEASLGESVEWAFLSYRPTPEWTLRAGRINPDAFLLADYRNVGFAYTWVRPEPVFYGTLPLYSLDGVEVAREWLGDGTRWKLNAFAGNGTSYGTTITGQPVTRLRAHGLTGLSLTRERDGLTLRATALRMRLEAEHSPASTLLYGGLQQLTQLPLPGVAAEAGALLERLPLKIASLSYLQLGVAYDRDDWLLAAEVAKIGGSFTAGHGVVGYASAGRRFGPYTVYAVLAASHPDSDVAATPQWQAALTPVLGPQFAAQAQMLGTAAAGALNSQRLDQRSLSLGLRWDFDPRMALKLQWDHYRIDANGHMLWSNAQPRTESVNVGTVVLDFVF